MVHTLILRLVGDPDRADDLAQDVFVKAWQALPSFRGGSRISTWIYRIAHNLAVNELRGARRWREAVRIDDVDVERRTGAEAPDDPIDTIDRERAVRRLWTWIAELKPEQRAALTLYYSAGRSYREIADVMDLPIGTVKTLLFRARGELRERLHKEMER